ncbi:hypothetical protein L208DRAFT_1418038, partial [Tricholoma matsutake]
STSLLLDSSSLNFYGLHTAISSPEYRQVTTYSPLHVGVSCHSLGYSCYTRSGI